MDQIRGKCAKRSDERARSHRRADPGHESKGAAVAWLYDQGRASDCNGARMNPTLDAYEHKAATRRVLINAARVLFLVAALAIAAWVASWGHGLV